MSSIKLKLYLLDTIKIDSPQHIAFKKFSRNSLQQFPKLIGTGIRQNKQDTLQILTNKKLNNFEIESINNDEQKIIITFDILKSIWEIYQNQYFMGFSSIQHYLLINKQINRIKFKSYLTVPIKQFQWGEIKKDKTIAKNGIQLCYQLQKISYKLDIWKWAVFTSTFIYKFSLDKYIDKIFSCQKIQQFNPQVNGKNLFFGSQQLCKILQKCLKINPKDRPDFQDIALVYRKLMANISLSVDSSILNSANQLYTSEQKSMIVESQLQITQNIILTQKLKKQLSSFFVRYGKKSPSSYKPLFRATKYNFSPRLFYQQCSNCNNLLFVIDAEQVGIICSYIEPSINACEKGLNGEFISDPDDKSYIFSEKHQACFKLSNKDKAFKSVPGYGPIIGDGDIILGNNRNNNWSHFPRSYNGGTKKLTTKTQFIIKNYDVYRVIF